MGHFARELELAGLISDDANLRDVIQDTQYDTERYKQFAREAAQDDDGNAAALFTGLAADGASRIVKFEATLAGQKKPTQ